MLYLTQILFMGLAQINYYSAFSIDIEPLGLTQNLISLLTGVFSILLLLLSISSYRKTGIKNILYASGAFGLFGIRLFIEVLEENYNIWDSYFVGFVTSSLTLAILVLFFLAIIKRNK
jgi:hypothetical protein